MVVTVSYSFKSLKDYFMTFFARNHVPCEQEKPTARRVREKPFEVKKKKSVGLDSKNRLKLDDGSY